VGKKTPPFSEYELWTTARFWSFIRSALRKAFTRWPPKYTCLNNAKTLYDGDNNRQKWQYECAECGNSFMQKEVECDHIIPAGSLKDYSDLHGFVERLFVSEDKLRILCKPCHKAITKRERK